VVQVVSYADHKSFVNDLNEAIKNTNNERAANKCQCQLGAVKEKFFYVQHYVSKWGIE
jgi:hypothetical protein